MGWLVWVELQSPDASLKLFIAVLEDVWLVSFAWEETNLRGAQWILIGTPEFSLWEKKPLHWTTLYFTVMHGMYNYIYIFNFFFFFTMKILQEWKDIQIIRANKKYIQLI